MAIECPSKLEHLWSVSETETATPDLDRLFYPKNIAVVGASPRGGGFMWGGNTFIEGALKENFKGKIFPVHPKAENILGMKAYKSIREIPEEVDFVIFSVPHAVVLPIMKDCAAKGVKFVHLFTAGFSETGREENIEIEKELVRLARESGIRVIGPNCMGIYCPEGGLAWTRDFPRTPGPVGFISQSGQLAGHFIEEGRDYGLRFSKVVSYGNASDLQCHDFLKYIAQDEKTKIIGLYIEGLKDGRSFFEAARNITRVKPMVAWKGGLTEGGSRATQSHTASLAGSPKIWQALCRQSGIISVSSMEELITTLAALQRVPLPHGRNAAILGGAGGGSVTMTDAAEREGLSVPHLTEKTIRSLEEFVPLEGSSVKNPLDMMGAFFKSGQDSFLKTFTLLRDDPNIDALIFLQMVEMFVRRGARLFLDGYMKQTLEGVKALEKPAFIVLGEGRGGSLEAEALRQEMQARYNQAGFASFPSFPLAARVMFSLFQYRTYLEAHGR
ncbi:MAG: CoA-binding protein [Deltaproteobacteria bacterium]|nr:CoA-binding protein [Deltaproteobacteria bacterium]